MIKRILIVFSVFALVFSVNAQDKKVSKSSKENEVKLMKVESKSLKTKREAEIIPPVFVPKKPELKYVEVKKDKANLSTIQAIKSNLSQIRELDFIIENTSELKKVSDYDSQRVKLIDDVLAIDELSYKKLDLESRKTILGLAKERGDESLDVIYPWFKESYNK